MQAVVYRGKDRIAVEQRPVPTPAPTEVLIRVHRAGICGTDLSIVAGQHPRAQPALIMGHEFVGTIAELGSAAPGDLKIGERVVVEPLISCGKCYACRAGFDHVCDRLGLYGIDADGAFAEFIRVAADKVVRVPDQITDQTATLIEPLAVAVHAVRMSALKVGDRVCVLGGGPIGLLVALVAGETGVQDLLLVEPQPHRAAIARQFGLTVLDPSTTDVVENLQDRTAGRGVDTVFEAAGAPDTILAAPRLCCARGEIVQVAMPKVPRDFDVVAFTFRELTMKGVRVYDAHDFRRALQLAATWQHDIARIASTPFPLDDAESAFTAARLGDRALKVVFNVAGE